MSTIALDNTWPASLPLPYVQMGGDSYYGVISSPSESARILRRDRFGTRYLDVTAQWRLDATQFAAFQAFFELLGNGGSRFGISLRFPKNTELQDWKALFVGGYEVQFEEGVWSVQAPLNLERLLEVTDADLVGASYFLVASETTGGADEQFVGPSTTFFAVTDP